MARIDASFSGTFSLQLDNNQSYTYKSQYLTHARLTGSNNSNLLGNALDNQLAGNSGANVIDGAEGSDTILLQGNFSEYSIQKNGSSILLQDSINDRDGSIEIKNIEILKFADKSSKAEAL
jgi:Ca2+-binding RTX toxin-like protein